MKKDTNMKLRILSDLHYEGYKFNYKYAGEDVLILAGDIDVGFRTVDTIKKNFPADIPIIFVAGNHEFYHHDIWEVRGFFEEKFHNTNVIYLENGMVTIDGIRFIGTTLFTDFDIFPRKLNDYTYLAYAQKGISDFKVIHNKDKLWTALDQYNECIKTKEYLGKILRMPFDGKTVVVTHFIPTIQCVHTRFRGSNLTPYFATNCEHMMEKVDLWVHGHTHDAFDLMIGNTRVVANPFGYAHENNNGFIADKIVEV